ncbi:transposase [Dyadobacter arcticus]|uniref:transposase n=1 Tax=Dyadobacter arcticus TaxID=1078754 RepID=UPI0035B5C77C
MENRFKSLSLFEFQSPNDEKCTKYLSGLKWVNEFKCNKCKHDKYCTGNKPFGRQCTRSNTDSIVTK